jgi:tetratricopeptide (TPR) repeat protein
MHIGNLATAAGDWKVAAEHYAAAYQAKPDDHQLGMLLANALSKSGDQEGGDKQFRATNLALLMPETRRELASIIREPTLKQEAVRQYEIVLRTALPDSQSATQAAQAIGNIVSTDHPRRSALCWQQMLLHVLNPSGNFSEPEAYPALSHVIHSTLARAALAEGQRDIVAAERAQCDKLLPADINSVLKLVPHLRSGGVPEIADQVLDRALEVHRQVLDEFPTSATYRNNAAWMAARCQRKLDEALVWAEKAVALAPDEPSYYDTLAEVHFQRGDRDAALAAAQKAVDLSPQNTFFAARLKHFQDDELKSLGGLDAE